MTVFITPLECHFDIQIVMDVKRMEMENEVKMMKFGNHCIIYVQESNKILNRLPRRIMGMFPFDKIKSRSIGANNVIKDSFNFIFIRIIMLNRIHQGWSRSRDIIDK
jgi:hypothetical protein